MSKKKFGYVYLFLLICFFGIKFLIEKTDLFQDYSVPSYITEIDLYDLFEYEGISSFINFYYFKEKEHTLFVDFYKEYKQYSSNFENAASSEVSKQLLIPKDEFNNYLLSDDFHTYTSLFMPFKYIASDPNIDKVYTEFTFKNQDFVSFVTRDFLEDYFDVKFDDYTFEEFEELDEFTNSLLTKDVQEELFSKLVRLKK